ncbi:MAG: glycosyltransferase [Parcubacteria group bacterium Gr01-1014_56]|nr:MAG: glycosyltransferase [Parcubacteria group bacterium Gr01-1014_56]
MEKSSKDLTISILIPCYNEEKSVVACIRSCLDQTRPADEVVVVNDGSTDNTAELLKTFGSAITVVEIPVATGNKSHAQEIGLKHITSDIVVTTDGDTILNPRFIERVAIDFTDPSVAAMGGYVVSLSHNWLTACRELDYILGQDLYKRAQAYLHAIFVIPGCAGAFRVDLFRNITIGFDHDTLTEDLDLTYKLHVQGLKIVYDREAIVYTQDPATLSSYINQMRRWYCGGWQNLLKHYQVLQNPANAFTFTLIYIEGTFFAALLFMLPVLNFVLFVYFVLPYIVFLLLLGMYGSLVRKRWDLLLYSPTYIVLLFINAFIFLEQFVKEIVLRKKNMVWFHPECRRIQI